MCSLERGNAARAFGRSSVRYARATPVDTETGKMASLAQALNETAIERGARYDGYFCIITSEVDMRDRAIIDICRGLWRIEESFCVIFVEVDLTYPSSLPGILLSHIGCLLKRSAQNVGKAHRLFLAAPKRVLPARRHPS